MAIITVAEIIDIFVMTIAIGFIFKDAFKASPEEGYEPRAEQGAKGLDLDGLKFAIIVTAPAIVLHELGHKIMGLIYGLNPVFHAAYLWLAIGVLLKLISFPLIFFVPAYVTYQAGGTPLQQAIIAFAGPGVNLVLWVGSWAFLKTRKDLSSRTRTILALTSQINMFLFIFNMIPVWRFDGAHVVSNLAEVLS